jgi:hypothetical protein
MVSLLLYLSFEIMLYILTLVIICLNFVVLLFFLVIYQLIYLIYRFLSFEFLLLVIRFIIFYDPTFYLLIFFKEQVFEFIGIDHSILRFDLIYHLKHFMSLIK